MDCSVFSQPHFHPPHNHYYYFTNPNPKQQLSQQCLTWAVNLWGTFGLCFFLCLPSPSASFLPLELLLFETSTYISVPRVNLPLCTHANISDKAGAALKPGKLSLLVYPSRKRPKRSWRTLAICIPLLVFHILPVQVEHIPYRELRAGAERCATDIRPLLPFLHSAFCSLHHVPRTLLTFRLPKVLHGAGQGHHCRQG